MTVREAGFLFIFAAITHGVLAFYTISRSLRKEQHDIETPIAFGDALAATQTASLIYEEEILQEDEPDD
jgi:hypothetical protein